MELHINNLEKLAGGGSSLVENAKSIKLREKQSFMSLLELLSFIDDRTMEMVNLGINLIEFEDPYFKIIEDLLVSKYGGIGASLIIWWCTERKSIEEKTYNLISEDGTNTMISSPTQLYKFITEKK
jgi:hypothetical protein